MEKNRLYRIVNGRVIGGVAGGISEYFNIDPTIIRILFILLTIFGGGGVLIYIVMWIVVPEKYSVYPPFSGYPKTETSSSGSSNFSSSGADYTPGGSGVGETYSGYAPGTIPPSMKTEPGPTPNSGLDGSLIAGLILILIGGFFLFERFIPAIHFSDFWPLLFIVIGLFMIFKGFPGMKKQQAPEVNSYRDPARETRSNDSGTSYNESNESKDINTNNDINI